MKESYVELCRPVSSDALMKIHRKLQIKQKTNDRNIILTYTSSENWTGTGNKREEGAEVCFLIPEAGITKRLKRAGLL
jgi:hypothetical protein